MTKKTTTKFINISSKWFICINLLGEKSYLKKLYIYIYIYILGPGDCKSVAAVLQLCVKRTIANVMLISVTILVFVSARDPELN